MKRNTEMSSIRFRLNNELPRKQEVVDLLHRLHSPAQPQPKFEGSELDSEHERSDCTPESGLSAFQGDDIFSLACSRFAPVLNPRARTSFWCVLDDATEEVTRSNEDRPREEVNLYADYTARLSRNQNLREASSIQNRSEATARQRVGCWLFKETTSSVASLLF